MKRLPPPALPVGSSDEGKSMPIALLKIINLPRIVAIGTPLALLIFIVTLYNAMHFDEGFPLIRADRTVIVSV